MKLYPLQHKVYYNPRLSKKCSSCSTIFLDDSTVSQPNLKSMVKWYVLLIELVLHGSIKGVQLVAVQKISSTMADQFVEHSDGTCNGTILLEILQSLQYKLRPC